MTQKQPRSNGKRSPRPKPQGTARGKHIRAEPTRRKRIDPDMIALCYWLLAQRIVQEAGDDRHVADHPGTPAAGRDDPASDAGTKGARSSATPDCWSSRAWLAPQSSPAPRLGRWGQPNRHR